MRRKIEIDMNDFRSYSQTHTADETAARFGVSISFVYQTTAREGIRFVARRGKQTHERTDIADYAKTHTMKETAEHFSTTVTVARYWCKKYGVEPLKIYKNRSELHTKEFWEKHRNLNTKQIAELTGASTAMICNARKEFKDALNLPDFRRCGGIRAEKKEMIAYLAKKYTLASIAEAFGVSREWVRQIVDSEEKENDNDAS